MGQISDSARNEQGRHAGSFRGENNAPGGILSVKCLHSTSYSPLVHVGVDDVLGHSVTVVLEVSPCTKPLAVVELLRSNAAWPTYSSADESIHK